MHRYEHLAENQSVLSEVRCQQNLTGAAASVVGTRIPDRRRKTAPRVDEEITLTYEQAEHLLAELFGRPAAERRDREPIPGTLRCACGKTHALGALGEPETTEPSPIEPS